MEHIPGVFDTLLHFKTILPSVESLSANKKKQFSQFLPDSKFLVISKREAKMATNCLVTSQASSSATIHKIYHLA